jgi:hypothetical protein
MRLAVLKATKVDTHITAKYTPKPSRNRNRNRNCTCAYMVSFTLGKKKFGKICVRRHSEGTND